MAKLFFNYSTMNAGKSSVLLQAAHNYRERGMQPYLLTARIDGRAGAGRIASRIGISADPASTLKSTPKVSPSLSKRTIPRPSGA